VCAWGLPSVLIPLPTAAADHQTFNARAMADAGAARLLSQETMLREGLGTAIDSLLGEPAARRRMAEAARARGRPDAARDIVSHLLTLVHAT
jgi:UDP-N-acetylglucosamine--N-acetylmuramyl-(pentapeptide) pyrophosphoryl-undecaprenol N-acetylglucosamine transferase